uniref:NUDIX domain-containing protein n=1 Tax=Amycolatopsis sp. CA-096443 TaxID=3239919 RepID=UPI003F491086
MTAPASPPGHAGGATVLACGLLRDPDGRILVVSLSTDHRDWARCWLPGDHVPADGGAAAALRRFLSVDLGIDRPRLGGQQVTSSGPAPHAPGGQFLLLFDCGTVQDDQIDRTRLRPTAWVRDAFWITLEQARTLLDRNEFRALTLALDRPPSGTYRHTSPPRPPETATNSPASAQPRTRHGPPRWPSADPEPQDRFGTDDPPAGNRPG